MFLQTPSLHCPVEPMILIPAEKRDPWETCLAFTTGSFHLCSFGQSASQVSPGSSGFEVSSNLGTDLLEPPPGFTGRSNVSCVSPETVWSEQSDIVCKMNFVEGFPLIVLYSNNYVVPINVGDSDQGKVTFSMCLSSPWCSGHIEL